MRNYADYYCSCGNIFSELLPNCPSCFKTRANLNAPAPCTHQEKYCEQHDPGQKICTLSDTPCDPPAAVPSHAPVRDVTPNQIRQALARWDANGNVMNMPAHDMRLFIDYARQHTREYPINMPQMQNVTVDIKPPIKYAELPCKWSESNGGKCGGETGECPHSCDDRGTQWTPCKPWSDAQ